MLSALVACTGELGPGAAAPGAERDPASNTGGRAGAQGSVGGTAGAPTGPPQPPPPSGSELSNLSCDARSEGAAPRRIWRLRDIQYRNAVAVLVSGRATGGRPPALTSDVVAPFQAVMGGDRFSSYAASYSMNDDDFRTVLETGAEVAARVLAAWKKEPGSCLTSGGSLGECVRTLLTQRGPLFFRRPLSAEEISGYVTTATKAAALGGNDDAMLLTLQALVMSPHFLFRVELGEGAPDAAGLVKLSPYELATAIAFSLTDAPPDEELWRAAEGKALAGAEQVRPHVERLLMGNLAERPAITRFLREYLRYDHASNIFKDGKQFAFHKPDVLERETEAWVADVLASHGRADFLKTLLTSTSGFVQAGTAPSYNLDGMVKSTMPAKISLPEAQRAGILTQPSLLAALSQSDANDPVVRGRYVAENFLCKAVPDLPVGMIPKLPDLGPSSTLRDKLAMHSKDPSCYACHQFMDPIGLGFEGYDHLGRFRTLESGKPVVTSGTLYGTGNGDGPFQGVVELSRKLAASPNVTQCFVRHTFRFFVGREEATADACAIAAAQDAFKGGNFVQAIAALFSSKPFLYRSVK